MVVQAILAVHLYLHSISLFAEIPSGSQVKLQYTPKMSSIYAVMSCLSSLVVFAIYTCYVGILLMSR